MTEPPSALLPWLHAQIHTDRTGRIHALADAVLRDAGTEASLWRGGPVDPRCLLVEEAGSELALQCATAAEGQSAIDGNPAWRHPQELAAEPHNCYLLLYLTLQLKAAAAFPEFRAALAQPVPDWPLQHQDLAHPGSSDLLHLLAVPPGRQTTAQQAAPLATAAQMLLQWYEFADEDFPAFTETVERLQQMLRGAIHDGSPEQRNNAFDSPAGGAPSTAPRSTSGPTPNLPPARALAASGTPSDGSDRISPSGDQSATPASNHATPADRPAADLPDALPAATAPATSAPATSAPAASSHSGSDYLSETSHLRDQHSQSPRISPPQSPTGYGESSQPMAAAPPSNPSGTEVAGGAPQPAPQPAPPRPRAGRGARRTTFRDLAGGHEPPSAAGEPAAPPVQRPPAADAAAGFQPPAVPPIQSPLPAPVPPPPPPTPRGAPLLDAIRGDAAPDQVLAQFDLAEIRARRLAAEELEEIRGWAATHLVDFEVLGLGRGRPRELVMLPVEPLEFELRWRWPDERLCDECHVVIAEDPPEQIERPDQIPAERKRWERGMNARYRHAMQIPWRPDLVGCRAVIWAVIDFKHPDVSPLYSQPLMVREPIPAAPEPEPPAAPGWFQRWFGRGTK